MSNPSPPAAQDGSDPSMEDILASIRRILNEDETQASPAPPPPEDPPKPDVLLLDASMMIVAPEVAPVHTHAEPDPDVEPDPQPLPVAAEAMSPYPEMDIMTPSPPVADPAPTSDLLAPETSAAAASSVDSLVRTLTAGRGTQLFGGGPTLEDLVRSELRPMLKEWLDANLPPIVERMVRIEIEKVVGRTDF